MRITNLHSERARKKKEEEERRMEREREKVQELTINEIWGELIKDHMYLQQQTK